MNRLNKALLQANIEKSAQYDFDKQKVFGSAYCVMQGEQILYQNCFGTIVPGNGEPVTERTLFRLASMTKPITAIAVLILVERGLLSLSDKVCDYLPEFQNLSIRQRTDDGQWIDCGKAKTDITILHLLTHTSGIGGCPEKVEEMTAEDRETIDNTIRFYVKAGLDFEPGTQAQYSATGAFDVLVKIVEKVTNIDFLSFLSREIFEPCQMPDTTFVPNGQQWDRLIALHNRVDGQNVVVPTDKEHVFETYPCSHYLGGAGLASTLHDYANFAKMLLNEGQAPQKQILRKETLQLMHTVYAPKTNKSEKWGLGVRLVVDEDYKTLPIGAYGWSGAYGGHFWVDPDNQVAAVFLKNSLIDGGAGNESAFNFEMAVNNSFE